MLLIEWQEASGVEWLSMGERVGLTSLLLPSFLLMTLGLVWQLVTGGGAKNRRRSNYRDGIWLLAMLQFLLAIAGLVCYCLGSLTPSSGRLVSGEFVLAEFAIDGISLLMLAMVSGVGWAIVGFSERYLQGDQRLNRFFGLLGIAVGSVSLMSLSGNLLQFLLFWFFASIGMHLLLQHFQDRPKAAYGAWSKFWVSRTGDFFLLLAAKGFSEFAGSWSFKDLAIQAELDPSNPVLAIASILLVLGCVIKSAQFPFHFWLSETLEAPTPVSAFMHAGIVNAGGFLIIRMSPVLIYSTVAMDILFVVGLVTLLFGSLVTLTQSSIKSQLVYSTIAQMGFMMLQCGVGGFVAAMLHLVGHSVYKSYAFLSSGMVISDRLDSRVALGDSKPHYGWFVAVSVFFLTLFWGTLWSLGMGPDRKPGALILSSFFAAAILVWLFAGIRQTAYVRWRAVAVSVVMPFLYCGSYLIVAGIASANVAQHWDAPYSIGRPILALIVVAIVAISSVAVVSGVKSPWLRALRVHASRGFYIESWIRRRWQLLSREL